MPHQAPESPSKCFSDLSFTPPSCYIVPRRNPPFCGAKTVPTVRLTDLGLLNLAPLPKLTDYWDVTLPTFGVRVSPKGTKTFVLKFRTGRQAIGRYPIISLADAHSEAKRILAERTLGKLRPRSITFTQAVALFIEDKTKNRRANTYEAYEWHLNRLGFKGHLADISHDGIARALAKIKSRSTYDHALVAARIFFNWAMKRRYIEHNPTFGLSPHGTPQRARVLTDAELKTVWKAAEQIGGHFGAIVKLLVATGQRRGEIAALQTSWIQNDAITIPAAITKNGREHQFPVGGVTSSILKKTAKSFGLLFPARGNEITPFSGWSKSKALLEAASGVTNWTLHDLRRTYATNMAKLGVPIHIIERLLNHVSGSFAGIVSVYNRNQYMPEMREAVLKYESWLTSLVGS